MNIQVSEQRKIEKEIKKGKSIGQKLRRFFIRPKPKLPQECPHNDMFCFFDIVSEEVYTKCRLCGKILKGSIDPHEAEKRQKKDYRNQILYRSLTRRK